LSDNRVPAVAGAFYPGNEISLKQMLVHLFNSPSKLADGCSQINFKEIIGIVSPHAGYQYSGYVAACGYSMLKLYKPSIRRAVIIGPNHHGVGSIVATSRKAHWTTPLGRVSVDTDGIKKLTRISSLVDLDDSAHEFEHSIEVQIPFLQYIYGNDIKILPVSMMEQDKSFAIDLGNAISEILEPQNDVIIASSDFTHYEPHSLASKKDLNLIKYAEKLDVDGFYDYIKDNRITVCGFGPIATLMTVSKKMNVSGGILLTYMTSGQITKDYDQVVGYASIAFAKW
jgi:hypothetical protein